MSYIKRSIEPIIEKAGKNFKAVLITGARQTGKSTLLKNLFPNLPYISFDDPFLEDQARQNPNQFLILNAPPAILDEAQRIPEFFRYIKTECDSREEYGLFFLSGSQLFRLMKDVSESLAGRVCIVEMSTFSLREIQGDSFTRPFLPTMEYIRTRKNSLTVPENIWRIIHRGSYPELYKNPELEWQQFYSSYIKTYLERDVRELSAVQNLDVFRRFMIAVAARTGQMVNYSNIAGEIEMDVTTVKRWISILEASGIIYILEPYTNSVLKRAIKTPKIYFRDTGLVCYLTRWLTPETLAYGAMAGNIFETYAVSEILKSYTNAGIDYRYCVSYYRGRDRKESVENEIDLIIEENGILYPVEIKKSFSETTTAASAFDILDKIPDKKRGTGAIICLCPQPGVLRENLFELPVWYI